MGDYIKVRVYSLNFPLSTVHYFNTRTMELGIPPGVEVVWRLEGRRCFEFNFVQTLPLYRSERICYQIVHVRNIVSFWYCLFNIVTGEPETAENIAL